MIAMLTSRALLALGVTAAVATTGAVGADAAKHKPPMPFATTSIVVQKSVGGIAVGASGAATRKRFGASHCSSYGCDYAGPANSYTVFAPFASKKDGTLYVTSVQFQSQKLATAARALHTNKNIGIGSSLARLEKAYPKLKKSVGPGTGVRYYRLSAGRTDTQFVVNSKSRVFEIDLFRS